MKMNRITKFCLQTLAIYLIASGNMYSQVTIGANREPVGGALLQLQQDGTYSGIVNATKGLALPRVKLTDLGDIAADIPSAVGQETVHVGLTVYNVNEDLCATVPIRKGIYVWDGDDWQKLGLTDDNYMVFQDQDGNNFKARKFGNAGIWMTENLKATAFAGTANGNQPILNAESSSSTARYVYPQSSTSIYPTTPPATPNNEGLLYNWSAATNYYQPGAVDQGQTNSLTPGSNEVETIGPNGPDSNGYFYVQGICPEGWHLPSDREWNQLEEEIYTNANKYSTYSTADLPFSGTDWQASWAYVAATQGSGTMRGSTPDGHGKAMMSQCPPSNSTKGKSLTANQGGFDVLPVGYALAEIASDYTNLSYFWTGSYFNGNNSANNGICRGIYGGTAQVSKLAMGRSTLNSVRCKKDD